MSEESDEKAADEGSHSPEQSPITTSESELYNVSQLSAEEQVSDSDAEGESDPTEPAHPVATPVAAESTEVPGPPAEVRAEVAEVQAEAAEVQADADSADFAKMVEESDVGAHSRDVGVGDKVSGVIVRIAPELSFVDFGGRSEGVIKTSEISQMETGGGAGAESVASVPVQGEPPGAGLSLSEGDPLEAYVMSAGEEIVLSRFLQSDNRSADLLYQAFKSGIPVEGKVTAVNKWGLGVELQGCRGFCPISQIDTEFVADTAAYKDQTLTFKITEFRNQGRNIVVSRRALLQADQQNAAASVREGIAKGREKQGKVTRMEPFGAFVDLGGGVEGLIHVSELSHQRVEHPKDVLETGQDVRVVIIRVKDLENKRKERISLSLKALEKDPWAEVKAEYPPGTVVKGKVESLEDFGAFVQLSDTVSGMVHVSEMADRRVKYPREVVSVGDEVTVAVLELDNRRRRLRLSIKQVESVEDAANLKEFNARQNQKKEDVPAGNALTDALKRAGLN